MAADIIGIMRYSVVTAASIGGWAATRGTERDAALASILAPERLAVRSALFKATALPCFAHEWASGHRFRLIVLISAHLPQPWRDDLEACAAAAPFLELVEVPYDGRISSYLQATVARIATGTGPILSFRIDDDDCLRSGMIGMLERYATEENLGRIVSFENGLYCGLNRRNRLSLATHVYRNNAFGISYVAPRDRFRSILELGSHRKLDEKAPMIVDPTPNAWLRSIHDAADTGSKSIGSKQTRIADFWTFFADTYPYIDPRALHRAYRAARDLQRAAAAG